MKRLYVIGGTMGVGKTTVCRRLARRLPNSAFLDGDWCWDMDPFQVTDATRAMVLDNISALLRNFWPVRTWKTWCLPGSCTSRRSSDELLSRLTERRLPCIPTPWYARRRF